VSADRLTELAAGFAAGHLDAIERQEFRALLDASPESARDQAASIIDTAALVSLSLPRQIPPAGLKNRLLSKIEKTSETPDPFQFVRSHQGDWIPLKVPGAFVKLLSMDENKDYAVVLGKLEPGATYPAHAHIGPEEIYILTGDLYIGDVRLEAGDFHHATAGSRHGINRSEKGCTILAILSKNDLAAQFAAG
jgi:anti-sigma factor ChrR (cupin superfamily)